MSRRIQRDTHKKVSSTGYQKMQGDLEVQGNLLGPAITNINAAIAKISATSTTPVKLTAPQVEGIMRGIEVRWQRQYNLANFSHYELQVSDDDESWYSLLLDGSGWKGNLNEDTDVKTELFTHANIPLREDAGDLVGISLYYRVRQVTFAEVRGEWSDSAYATTKGVQDVVLTDSRNRYIEISSKKGIYADDRQGHVIHDIPNAPIVAGMFYGGHIIYFPSTTYLETVSLEYNDNATSTGGYVASTLTNTTLREHIPFDLTNMKMAYVMFQTRWTVHSGKIGAGSWVDTNVHCSGVYNVSGWYLASRFQKLGMNAGGIDDIVSSFAFVPITWDAGIPYITWHFDIAFGTLVAAADFYGVNVRLYLVGVTV